MRKLAVPWLRLIAGLSPLCRKLDSRIVSVGFMADKVAQKHIFLLMFRVYFDSISAQMLHIHYQRRKTFLAKYNVFN